MITLLPVRASNRTLQGPKPIYQHMNAFLGLEIWEVYISSQTYNEQIVQTLDRYGKEHPQALWDITGRDGKVLAANYAMTDADYPGPFGALCKRYGKTYWGRESAQEGAR